MFPSALTTSCSNSASSHYFLLLSPSFPPIFASQPSEPIQSLRHNSRRAPLHYLSLPPPAYHPQPALTNTVSRTTHDTLSSATSCGSLQDGVNLRTDIEKRERVRDEEARARLWPLVYPEARSFTDVLKGAFGRTKHTQTNPLHRVSLDANDLTILKMEEEVGSNVFLC